ncbi:MAG: glutamine--tRNA ligase/YqeY domain fusion protein [gamma proteobacterium symbiont of Bathyaustriella thionipta]|nr:glutamine--tRNA ligase/YqeY domain fusion protein [gamma proteobacterium symbiont of Bathyaustriella thionipta]MCU7949619.1 glutamine--tRNA ligase/YqeY domain fusion protein [gamma proteobacterium symbiont of Bathyaustriella thionipta]MCU7954753.1 glutamine--tRNA ligase/YqeY domain fusion protein [gamma proteobacterium symbiont of Bathyaustriella thionipta]MCU7956593.1 glutamine--tRNA ligase/YqeY domain fusion protein [gamma proteobacterium symbiont of Bathyaustriella thionipta]MCU7967913.1 
MSDSVTRTTENTASETKVVSNFIRHIIDEDISNNKNGGKVVTRFPPEPNGYLHIGHAKSICLNFGLAQDYNGVCNLRFDDTNPEKEDMEYIDSIKKDVSWLGFEWQDVPKYASDYFNQLHQYAIELIKSGKAYVCSLSPDEAREYRGSLTEAGKDSPYRDQSVEENLDLFERMKQGEFDEGAKVLRAKIDMASPNINMRDPILYRIRKIEHHQTGNEWCIYPMYDYTHCISDAIEGITHSLCTLEFEDHRPLYDWVLDQLQTPSHPQQIEFARLNLNYTITSKRKLKQLVDENYVLGWDDPRMPTISGLRRRGYTPASIRDFSDRIGVTKVDGVVDMSTLEFCIREDLEHTAPRAMCVINPLKVTIDSWAEDEVQDLSAPRHPKDESMGRRTLKMTRVIYIDRSDFEEVPPPKYKRLTVDKEVRLRNSYVIKCNEVIKDAQGEVIELRCSHDVDTLGKKPQGRKVKGVIHWVSEQQSMPAEVRLYDRLFTAENPDVAAKNHEDDDSHFLDFLNADSLTVMADARAEISLADTQAGDAFQFEREGYFTADPDSTRDKLVFNRTVSLRDSWAKASNK